MRVLLLVLWCTLLTHARAETPCGSYEVSYFEFGPLYFRQANGESAGIDKDVVEEVARRTGCRFTERFETRARTWATLASGELDMTVSGLATPEREKYARFIPYAYSRNYLLVSNALGQRVSSLRAFAADQTLRLGVVRGFKHGEALDAWIDGLRAQGRVVEEADTELLVRVFALGRIDGFFSQPVVWTVLMQRHQLADKVRRLDIAPQDKANGCLVLSRRRVPEVDAERIRRAIEAMRRDGSMLAIFSRYMDATMAKQLATPGGA